MRILFTGASSFTGRCFVLALAEAGHDVLCTMTRESPDAYDPLRRRRVEDVARVAEIAWGLRFGDDGFLDLIRARQSFDLLCHHAADVTNYKSPDFDAVGALVNNARNLPGVLEALRAGGCSRVLATGSVFEGGEGAGSEGLPHFSAYGLSKALTAQVFAHECARRGVRLGKFVIPNPFGPLEDPRFTAYLARSWAAGETPVVKTPAYVRDNIHVSLLALAYRSFAESLPASPGLSRLSPSGYVESQGAFAQRFAREMEPRLGLPCPVELAEQTEFAEPRIRVGTDQLDAASLGWRESDAWDALAEFYAEIHHLPAKRAAPREPAPPRAVAAV